MVDQSSRKEWLGVLAKSSSCLLDELFKKIKEPTIDEWLRRPEIGTVMVRGRAGGTGSAFNMGEMTVTRCSLRLQGGVVGHGYVQGRAKDQAKQAALIDALMQTDQAEKIDKELLAPLRKDAQMRAAAFKRRADKTKVDFFTMVRGEN